MEKAEEDFDVKAAVIKLQRDVAWIKWVLGAVILPLLALTLGKLLTM